MSFELYDATVAADEPDTHLEKWAFRTWGAGIIGSRRQAHLAAKVGNILVNGEAARPAMHVSAGDQVTFKKAIPAPLIVIDISMTVGAATVEQPADPVTGVRNERLLDPASCHAGERILAASVRVLQGTLDTKGKVKRAIKSGEITLNGEAVEETRRLDVGDLLRLRHDESVALKKRDGVVLEVAYEDHDMAVVWKPSGIDTNGKESKTLELALPHNLQPSTAEDVLKKPQPVHRLDKATCGLVLVAKTAVARDGLCSMLAERKVTKRYRSTPTAL